MVAASIATAALGAVLGYASSVVYVIGLAAVATGLTAGATVSVVSLMLDGRLSRTALGQALVAVLVGWSSAQVAEDQMFRAHWTEDFAAAQQAAAGVDPASGIGPDELVFFATGADAALSAETRRLVGFDGPIARWLLRADAGVRLIGPASGGRGLAVGRVGALIWVVLEILLAALVARTLLRRVRRVALGDSSASYES
jgi:hypothetical protein